MVLHTYRPSGDTDARDSNCDRSSSRVSCGTSRRRTVAGFRSRSRTSRPVAPSRSSRAARCVLVVMLEIAEAGKQIDREVH